MVHWYRALGPLALLLASVSSAAVAAAEREVASRIDAVSVHPDAATVTRVGDVDLAPGASVLVFAGLPQGLDPDSLRVEGSASARVTIGAVQARPAAMPGATPDTAYEAKLRDLRNDREGWQTTLDALDAKRAMILRYSQSSPEKLSPEAKPLDIGQWTAAWDLVSQSLAKLGDQLRDARTHLRESDEQIRALEQGRQRPRPQAFATRDVSVEVDAEAATSARFSLTYRVANAGWQPVYDARLDTGGDKGKVTLDLVRRAGVTQRTGEDWTGVSIAVSTVRARAGTQAPEVATQRLAFWEPPMAMAAAAPSPRLIEQRARSAPAAMAKSEADAEPAPPQPAVEQGATLNAGAFQASFQIPGRVDVPSDGSTKSFRIGSVASTPDLTLRVAPSLDATAYLQARIVNGEDAPLLPGVVHIQRDGAFVGTGRLPLVAPGDSADLGFGADERVKVTRVPVRRKENEPTWFGQTKTETREFRTSVKNLHPFPVKVSLVDRVPISENTSITIEQLPQTTPPTDKVVADKRGVLGWTLDLAPNEQKDVRLAWRMKWPADRDVVFQTLPAGGS